MSAPGASGADVRAAVLHVMALTTAAEHMAEQLAGARAATVIWTGADTDFGRAEYRKACRAVTRRRRALQRILRALERLALDGVR